MYINYSIQSELCTVICCTFCPLSLQCCINSGVQVHLTLTTWCILTDKVLELKELYKNGKTLQAGNELVEAVLESQAENKWDHFLQALSKGLCQMKPVLCPNVAQLKNIIMRNIGLYRNIGPNLFSRFKLFLKIEIIQVYNIMFCNQEKTVSSSYNLSILRKTTITY